MGAQDVNVFVVVRSQEEWDRSDIAPVKVFTSFKVAEAYAQKAELVYSILAKDYSHLAQCASRSDEMELHEAYRLKWAKYSNAEFIVYTLPLQQ